jgi:hypothetical protein
MGELYPTKNRLALLRAVRDRDVYWWPPESTDDGEPDSMWEPPNEGGLKVSVRIEEMRAAGWVEVEPEPQRGYTYRWRLTDAGRAVLDKAGER